MEMPDLRCRTMKVAKSKDTGPEMCVRRLAHAQGYRYRLHRSDLPGYPDLVFRDRRKVIFVHECFWHGHDCSRGARKPVQNRDYWTKKLRATRRAMKQARAALTVAGWEVIVLWECKIERTSRQLANFWAERHEQ